MELTEFLLARIDEDERAIRGLWNAAAGLTDARLWGTPFQPSRLLADCEARRRVTSRCDMLLSGRKYGMVSDGEVVAAEDILCALALSYRDHPDYDPEWA